MKKIKLKQGTLEWEKARSFRIGGSEVYDIVRYYATDEELQNCGINAEAFREEAPYTTTWALYHKILADGLYRTEALEPEYEEYGHAVEPYGVYKLQQGRQKKLKPGEVFASDRLVASLDISGVAEEIDEEHTFVNGQGSPKVGQRFVCEQKSMLPVVAKRGIPYKYIVQAQYQITMTGKDFYILQVMVLEGDSPFIRGKICQMSKKTRYKFLDDNLKVNHFYFRNNEHLAQLIKTCVGRFFEDVKAKKEPTPFIEHDSKRNIIQSIWLNVAFSPEGKCDYDLSEYKKLKDIQNNVDLMIKGEMQKIVEVAKANNVCRFIGDGIEGKFSKDGKFLLKCRE